MTLTLDLVILHTAVHHSSTTMHTLNFIEIEETFCGRTEVQMDRQTFETGFNRSTLKSRPKKTNYSISQTFLSSFWFTCVCFSDVTVTVFIHFFIYFIIFFFVFFTTRYFAAAYFHFQFWQFS